MKEVRITQLDGSLPNLALMRISAFHRAAGDQVHFSRDPVRQLYEPTYDVVYGSAIFDFTADRVRRFKREFPDAVIGGTWDHQPGDVFRGPVVEDIIGNFRGVDYSHWPAFTASIGFSQRGCRLNCGFCGVPTKEGKPKPASEISAIWRGPGFPKHIHLLDNDFFGNPLWRERIAEIRDGDFKVCFNQGLNVRILTNEIAQELASIRYRDDQFERRRLYTAWDNVGDERIFFRGVDRLESAGIPPRRLMAFMLLGFDPDETWERIFYRFDKMVARGILPYPMVFGGKAGKQRRIPLGGHNHPVDHQRLGDFQRWVIKGIYRNGKPFATYDVSARRQQEDHTRRELFA